MYNYRKLKYIISIAITPLLMFCLFSIPVKAETSISQSTKKYVDGEFIVKFKSDSSSKSLNNIETMKKDLNRKTIPFGVEVLSTDNLGYTGSKLVKYKGNKNPEELAKIIKSNYGNNVEYIEPNYILNSLDINSSWVPSDPYYPNLWGLKNTGQYFLGQFGTPGVDINVEKAWDVTKGDSGVVVAVIDSGVDYTHPDLSNNMWKNTKEIPNNNIDDDGNGYVDDVNGWNFYQSSNNPMDDYGHGTHVAGTIAALDNTIGVIGVAPHVKIMSLKFLDSNGKGSIANAIKAINYAKKMGAKIINNSWGGGDYSQALYDTIKNYDGLFVAAAGNVGTDNDLYPNYPASYNLPNILSVAAIDNIGSLADFSNYGVTTVDVAAPGVRIYSTKPSNSYQSLRGTSMATSHVSGIAALVLSANPLDSAANIKDSITESVVKLPSLNGKIATGGMVNAYGAVTSKKNVQATP
ncbi:S8 family serine peptidase [Clostridium sp. SHJSY1]|uniref:S8 family peptidase n=1 Tax=Clostridium sp. SHJSY1 TaxID=2942483 RepID=UPI002875ECE5|nr:S8 family peptidase [Clostridium sp. SHJSY1]MDS0527442.1 S8 family serine peptidase [Clostridium sp. SHJSY1]